MEVQVFLAAVFFLLCAFMHFGTSHIGVVANGDPGDLTELFGFEEVVAVDGGLVHCDAAGVKPLYITGDFDSAPQELLERYGDVEKIPTPDQDQADLEKALALIFAAGVEQVTVFGAVGKRIDHTVTNLCLLARYPGRVRFVYNGEHIFCAQKREVIACTPGQTVSLLPFNGPVEGITTKGLKWELEGGRLTKEFVGISNVALAERVEIEFTSGDLLISHHQKVL